MTDSKIVRIWITAFTSLPNNVGGQGRRLIIAHFSTKRNRNGRIAARSAGPLCKLSVQRLTFAGNRIY